MIDLTSSLNEHESPFRHFRGTGLLSRSRLKELLARLPGSDCFSLLLSAGVTTVRDLGDRGGLAMKLRDRLSGPRVVGSGPPITVPRGHCWFLGGEVDGEDALRQRVRANAAMGADVIKVMASGGQLTPGSPPMWQNQFSVDELRLVVEEATRVGLPVAAHAHGTEAITVGRGRSRAGAGE